MGHVHNWCGGKRGKLHRLDAACNILPEFVAFLRLGSVGFVQDFVPVIDRIDASLLEPLGHDLYCTALAAMGAERKPDLLCGRTSRAGCRAGKKGSPRRSGTPSSWSMGEPTRRAFRSRISVTTLLRCVPSKRPSLSRQTFTETPSAMIPSARVWAMRSVEWCIVS